MSAAVTDAVIAALEADGLNVGDATGEGLSVGTAGYVVVYPLGDVRDGTLAAPWEDVDAGVQVTCVGANRWQAERLHDHVVEVLTAAAELGHVEVLPSGAVARDDDAGGPPLFYAYPRFTLHT